MRLIFTPFAVFMLTLCLSACMSQPVSYGPAVDFECRLSVWGFLQAPTELLVQSDDGLNDPTITRFNYRLDGDQRARHAGVPVVHSISKAKWAEFNKALKQYDPWTIPTKQPYSLGVDGITVTFDIRQGERYHRVQRWYPFGRKSEERFLAFTGAILDLLPD